ncbi:hypothetical protein [Oceanimonas marisflavi]|uniref:hypothetical protein n=1 Tax=Oceanimonas marisflavi TaxID=2059724 RepID=UPI0018E58CFD|nr:hypothetical protein [Oceanimonas marisflavi]
MTETLDWRSLSVRRDSRFEALEGKFCSTKNSENSRSVFSTVKEFMVFSALVGFQLDEFKPLESKVNSTPILLSTYATTKHDAYIYLIALSKDPSLEIIKSENLRDAIGIFEGYCNGGLHHIDNWVMNNVGEPVTTDILFNQTLEFLTENE